MERSTWTDDRLDDKMQGIDRTFDRIANELAGMRTDMREESAGMRLEMRELRHDLTGEMGALRSDFNALQRQLIHVGFTLVGVFIAAMIALIVAIA